MFPARLELATFRVLGGRDNHYTTETKVKNFLKYLNGEVQIIHINQTVGTTKHGHKHCYNHFSWACILKSSSNLGKLLTTSSKYTMQSAMLQVEKSWRSINENKIGKRWEDT